MTDLENNPVISPVVIDQNKAQAGLVKLSAVTGKKNEFVSFHPSIPNVSQATADDTRVLIYRNVRMFQNERVKRTLIAETITFSFHV